jgi:hypothetical protein
LTIRIDLAVRRGVLGNLIHAGRAHPLPHLRELARDAALDADVVRRVVACRVAADEHA